MDFNEQLKMASDKIIAEKLPDIIEKSVTSMIEGVVKDMFSTYGEMAKAVKTKIGQALDLNLDNFNLIDYNALVAQTINNQLVQTVNLERIKDLTQDITGFLNKKTISLQEICDILIEGGKEDGDCNEGAVSFHVDNDKSYLKLYMDVEPNIEASKCLIEMCVSNSGSMTGNIFLLRTAQKYFDTGRRSVTPARLIAMDRITHKLFRLYSAGVTVTGFDQSVETEWYN